MAVAELGSEVFPWLKSLPLAPEYHPTLAEFQDPIAYIFKIEQEASKYGICKIVPPLPPPPKRTTIVNLNRSLAARVSTLRSKSAPTFTTRQQQIGFCPRKPRPVQKPVWQSGEYYTFQQFEAKAKNFEKNYLKKSSKKSLSALEIETLFWKASVDKPFSIEYANDMPGSAFVPVEAEMEAGEAVTVGETAWNMRRVSKSKESLLRFMKEEIPGVTSPMVYIAMIFSWFAWHVEDHDLHSLNYLHLGTGKTWYGVPRDAAVAFEEVVRVYGYGEEVNPLVTFAILGEKTTVMSPEVFIKAGIPCCRLVQNPGEFVVTFPRAYHSGFSHGFNCAEASNIATPGWLRVAKEAAVRRASINYPPMVSHLQLLYDLALALSSRIPKRIGAEPRSSRLKDKKKGEGQTMIKELFVQNVVQNNDLLQILGKGSPIVLLPASYSDTSICSNFCARSKLKLKPRLSLGLSSQEEAIKASNGVVPDDVMLDTKGVKQLKGFYSLEENVLFPIERYRFSSNRENGDASTHMSYARRQETERGSNNLSDQKLFSCVKCGILSYDCVAIVQPKHAAAKYLMSADCSFFNDWVICSGVINDGSTISSKDVNSSKLDSTSGWMGKRIPDGLYEVPIQSMDDQIQVAAQSNEMLSDTEVRQDTNSLGLLALNYGNSSDSEDGDESDTAAEANIGNCSAETELHGGIGWNSYKRDRNCCPSERCFRYSSRSSDEDEASFQTLDPSTKNRHRRANFQNRNNKTFDEIGTDSPPITMDDFIQRNSSTPTTCSNAFAPMVNEKVPFASRSDEDSSRMHIFCLEHASEVEQQLSPIGGVHMLLLCHADYPRVEARAKSVAEELGFDHIWNNVVFRDATRDDEKQIQSALNSEDAIPSNGDWAVKLGINLYYSVILSHSPLYSKQMPYNSIIYNAFGRNSTVDPLTKPKVQGKWVGRHKKIVVAGKWCGKVWMSNQVHPLLVPRDEGEGEEFEQERGFSSWARPDEIRAETGCRAEFTPVTKKLYKWRKTGEDARRTEVEDLVETSEDSADDFHQYQNCQNLRNKRVIRCNLEQKHIQSNSFSEDEGGPSTRLRKRNKKYPSHSPLELEPKIAVKKRVRKTKAEKARAASRWSPVGRKEGNAKQKKIKDDEGPYVCDAEGCTMCFDSKPELALHKRNICPVKGCGKKFFSHKYLLQHRRVHLDDRPLKCPWKGCKMTFKWAWARTEHIRVHTGARPYICAEPGCSQTFRFVSDFSRHKRKTGHSVKKGKSK